ncbi:uncharacterized protein METZ01_LOCUS402458, partial [marine metagenome]
PGDVPHQSVDLFSLSSPLDSRPQMLYGLIVDQLSGS